MLAGGSEETPRADPASFRYFTEGAFDPIAVVAGLIQTAIYADFGYIVSPLSYFFLIPLASLHRWSRRSLHPTGVSVPCEQKMNHADELSLQYVTK